MELEGSITGFVPGRSIAFHLESRVNALDVEYCVEPIPGGTRLQETADVHWRFPVNVLSLFFGEKMRQGILAQLQREFTTLKQLCEAGQP